MVEFVEIVVDDDAPAIFVTKADCVPQLDAEWLVLQPDVIRNDPRMGWEAVGGRFEGVMFVGSDESEAVTAGQNAPSTVCAITDMGGGRLQIENFSERRLDLISHNRR